MSFVFSRKILFKQILLLAITSFAAGCTSKTLTKNSPVQNIDPVDIRRLEFAQSSIEKISQDWRLGTNSIDKTCIVLFGDQHEWILNCADSFLPNTIPVSSFRGRSVDFTPNSLTIPMASVPYAQIAASVVAQATVLTPHQQKEKNLNLPPFILVQKLEDLVEHHPGFPKDSTKTEELLSIYVHEFFHILQFTNPHVSQFIDSALQKKCFADQSELIHFYEKNLDYQQSIKSEYQLLSGYLKNESSYSPDSAQRVLKKWLRLYKKRIHKYSASFSKGNPCLSLKTIDSFWTFAEGTARYVESQFLLNPKLHEGMETLKDDSSFGHFASITSSAYPSLPSANKNLGAKYYYAIGSHLSFLLDQTGNATWKEEAFANPNWLIGAVESTVK